MRKFTFILGLVVMTTSLAFATSNYSVDGDYYSYTGDPVDEFTVDFTTWSTSDLESTLSDDMTLQESHNVGIVKWKIAERPCGSKGTVNALFNNNNSDFSEGPTNANTTNKPRIYLPTTSTGVANISVHGMGNVPIGVRYKDAKHSSWTWAGSLALPSSYGEAASLALNTTGKTSICLEYLQTAWPTITDITLETLYKYNSTKGIYEYSGEPVDAINVDFTNSSKWWVSLLPGPLSDDMALEERNGIGFVKWKIAQYNPGTGNIYVLFNNNNNDFSEGPNNSTTTNRPAIYFPTTVRGIESIAITYFLGANAKIHGTYTDGVQTKTEAIDMPASVGSEPQTVVWNLNSGRQTSVYLKYGYTAWPRIKSIVFTLKDTENTPLGLWDTSDTDNDSKLEKANGEVRDVYLNRSFVADGGYYTLCLPFDLTAGQVTSAFGDCKLAKLSSSEMRGSLIHLTFDYVNTIKAGEPYLFLPSADIADCAFPGVRINTDASRENKTTYFKMTGIYNPTSLSDGDFYMGEDNYLLPVTSDEPLRPFRSYFSVIESVPKGVRARVMFAPEHATDIEFVQSDNIPYTKELRDGHLYIRRGETIYTLSGQIVK